MKGGSNCPPPPPHPPPPSGKTTFKKPSLIRVNPLSTDPTNISSPVADESFMCV